MVDIPADPHYWLLNARVPQCLLTSTEPWRQVDWRQGSPQQEELVAVDIEVDRGQIQRLVAGGEAQSLDIPAVNLHQGLVWPCFVDAHTHLDKGHIWPRQPNPDGTFERALAAVQRDREAHWGPEDVFRRMAFGLNCSYAHGTQAIRTHLDAFGPQAEISFAAFRSLQAEWAGRLTLQAVCLVTLDYFSTPDGERLADLVAETPGGILGGVAFMNDDIVAQIDRTFALAEERGLDLDFHTDESLNPADIALRHVAETKLNRSFSGRVTCDHCCSLSVQSPDAVEQTLSVVKAAGVAIVSLPMCNLYLQDRQPGRMPRLRGVTLLPEMQQRGIATVLASDNCRDPFFAYGDHDGLEVFVESVRIGQLDRPYGAWPRAVTTTAAEVMGLPDMAKIGVGQPADLVCFQARTLNELVARRGRDRTVIRNGQPIDSSLPSYADLDDLVLG
ncbi:MAG: cytosine deaminase [Cyanobacteria bacterium P01_A01_bin.105]